MKKSQIVVGDYRFGELKIVIKNGKYGPYIQNGKKNVSIPKSIDPEKITLEECKNLLSKKK